MIEQLNETIKKLTAMHQQLTNAETLSNKRSMHRCVAINNLNVAIINLRQVVFNLENHGSVQSTI